MKSKNKILLFIMLTLFFACTKEKKYQYDINDVAVGQDGGNKTNQKSTTEFISIAYADLFGTNIPQTKLVNLSVVYSSFGDLKVIEERIISNLLNDSSAIIPALPSVSGDTILFIVNTYKKFFH